MPQTLPAVERTKYRDAIKASNISVRQVSNYLGLSYAYTSSILCGTVNLTPDNKAKLDELFDRIVWGADEQIK